MNMFDWLRAGLSVLWKNDRENSRNREKYLSIENGTYIDRSTYVIADFEANYKISTDLLKEDLNKNFPDNYHAELMPRFDPKYNYSERRLEAIDTSSSAIAAALRNGASISEAVLVGSRSIGLQHG